MLYDNSSLDLAAAQARRAKVRGERFIEFEIDACDLRLTVRNTRVILWEGCIGEAGGTIYKQPAILPNPDLAQPRTIARFRVRAEVVNILSAQQRRQQREEKEYAVSVDYDDNVGR